MRTLAMHVSLVLALGGATAAYGQPPTEARGQAGQGDAAIATSVDGLSSRLRPADRIYVLTTGGEEVEGRFTRASETTLTLEIDGRLRDLPAPDVQQVRRRGGRRIGRGAWVGFLIGAGGGLAAAAASGSGSDWSFGERAALAVFGFGGMGAEVGAVVGIFVHDRPVVYQKASGDVNAP